MKKNVGLIDRTIRGIIGAVLLLIAVLNWSNIGIWSIVLTVFGVILLGTAAIGYCPPYSLLGISTCKKD